MGTGFGNPTILEEYDAVCIADGRGTMRDDKDDLFFCPDPEVGQNTSFGLRVQRSCRFIENKDSCIANQCPSY